MKRTLGRDEVFTVRQEKTITISHSSVSYSQSFSDRQENIVRTSTSPYSPVIHNIVWVEEKDRYDLLVDLLNVAKNCQEQTIVFVSNGLKAEALQRYLLTKAYNCVCLHGGHSSRYFDLGLEALASKKASILVTTDAIAHSSQIPSVKHVIQFDMPKNICEYNRHVKYSNGLATLFFNQTNKTLAHDLWRMLIALKQTVPDWLYTLAFKETESSLLKPSHNRFNTEVDKPSGLISLDTLRESVRRLAERCENFRRSCVTSSSKTPVSCEAVTYQPYSETVTSSLDHDSTESTSISHSSLTLGQVTSTIAKSSSSETTVSCQAVTYQPVSETATADIDCDSTVTIPDSQPGPLPVSSLQDKPEPLATSSPIPHKEVQNTHMEKVVQPHTVTDQTDTTPGSTTINQQVHDKECFVHDIKSSQCFIHDSSSSNSDMPHENTGSVHLNNHDPSCSDHNWFNLDQEHADGEIDSSDDELCDSSNILSSTEEDIQLSNSINLFETSSDIEICDCTPIPIAENISGVSVSGHESDSRSESDVEGSDDTGNMTKDMSIGILDHGIVSTGDSSVQSTQYDDAESDVSIESSEVTQESLTDDNCNIPLTHQADSGLASDTGNIAADQSKTATVSLSSVSDHTTAMNQPDEVSVSDKISTIPVAKQLSFSSRVDTLSAALSEKLNQLTHMCDKIIETSQNRNTVPSVSGSTCEVKPLHLQSNIIETISGETQRFSVTNQW